ncbi:RagB/SusD family nutrient uptake outer membrane protein [Paraflavisolibacter sp. H34]|uniref:RagB/SusD family nutrient uptake outer membrane protein n=1 Tax=Huijunlia imazamoxiresistens TaxID=3127457 RepID=UPI0030160361
MKIKNNRWITALCLSALLLTAGGCKKYLNQVPDDSLTRNEFFRTKADATSAIMGVYDGLQACADKFLSWGEFRADLISPTSNTDVTYPYYELFDPLRPASDWTAVYNLIGRANIVIEAVPDIPARDSRFSVEESNAIVGEALFLRSLAYFYLVRTFKEVPLVVTAPSNDAVDYFPAKASADSVLNKLEADLKVAEASVPVEYAKSDETRGRVTKGAVHSLLADVYLWRAKYAEAAAAAQKVLDNKSLYTLVPGASWLSIFAQKNTSESIFEIQYNYVLSENNSLKGNSGAFNMNNVLYDMFTGEQDLVRGANNTYTAIGARVFWKYRGLTTDNIERATNDPNFIVYRLPDVMLLQAEALAHLGPDEKAEAVRLLNAVRERAGLPIYDNYDGNTPLGLIIEALLKERAMELAMEGKRWFDLVRVATNENNPDILVSRVLNSRTVGERSLIRSRIIDPRSWYLPIATTEIQRNKNLVQNPFYK